MQNASVAVEEVGGKRILRISIDLDQTIALTQKGNEVVARSNGAFEQLPELPGHIVSLNLMRWERKSKAATK